jgi:hypothetical protein
VGLSDSLSDLRSEKRYSTLPSLMPSEPSQVPG